MATREIRFQEKHRLWLVSAATLSQDVAHGGHPLGGLPVSHPRVVEPRRDEKGGVVGHAALIHAVLLLGRGGRLHVVNGGVALDVVVVLTFVGVPPLLPLDDSQGNAWVTHGRHDVHKGHARHRRVEQAGRGSVQARSNEQAASRSPLDRNFRRRAGGLQELGAIDEVVEGVALCEVLALLLVPPSSQLGPAADVSDHVSHASVEQRKPRHPKAGVHAAPVGPVAVQVRGPLLALKLGLDVFSLHEVCVLLEDHRHWDQGAVPGLGLEAKRGVLGGVVSGHLLHLHERACAGLAVHHHRRIRGHHARVDHAEGLRVEDLVPR
mmetsp:Transcript_11757/g.29716  ORF Transcript_11757/g.29716 Transcript_11757/m.29716 type:complete len:322 (+) Transcript_11757:524-1489(+)